MTGGTDLRCWAGGCGGLSQSVLPVPRRYLSGMDARGQTDALNWEIPRFGIRN